jgi:hypothetical protein
MQLKNQWRRELGLGSVFTRLSNLRKRALAHRIKEAQRLGQKLSDIEKGAKKKVDHTLKANDSTIIMKQMDLSA